MNEGSNVLWSAYRTLSRLFRSQIARSFLTRVDLQQGNSKTRYFVSNQELEGAREGGRGESLRFLTKHSSVFGQKLPAYSGIYFILIFHQEFPRFIYPCHVDVGVVIIIMSRPTMRFHWVSIFLSNHTNYTLLL